MNKKESFDVMILINVILLSTVVSVTRCHKFPPGFKFGAATSAYQTEGAWNVSDKSESIWDRFSHTPNHIVDGSTGDVACNSYHDWEKDVQMVVDLGLDFYRFSISWTRILPTGFPNYISEEGRDHYNKLINALLENGVEPIITLYHWDLPQRLQDLGGWTNPLITNWFADYARVVYTHYADRVKTWITINEPQIMCDLAYNTGILAPGIKDPEFANYLCSKHTLVAHAKAWRIYDEKFKPKYKGQVSIANQMIWLEPESPEEQETVDLLMQYMAGIYSHPIYSKEGGWPPSIEKIIKKKSLEQGYMTSRLPAFTKREIKLVRGTFDYYSLNYYTSRLVRKSKDGESSGVWPLSGSPELGAINSLFPGRRVSSNKWLQVYPVGLRRQMIWLKEHYGNIPIFISENGYSVSVPDYNDEERVQYYEEHLKEVLLAITKDGINVTGFTAWTLMDNFEWYDGYTAKYGLYEVDFDSPNLKRTPRASAKFYKNLIKTRSLHILDKAFDEL